MKNLLLSQDLRNIPEDYIHDHPDCGRLRIHSIGLDKIDVLRKFYNKCFRPGYILGDKELFQWFFKHNGGHVVAISKDDEIIAHQGYVPIVFTNGNQDYRGFISASTMVSEDYRRKGLMTYLRSGIQENYDMAVSLGGSAIGIALYSSMNYRYFGDLLRMVAIIDPDKCQVTVKNSNDLYKTVAINDEPNTRIKTIGRFEDISIAIDELRDNVFPRGTFFGVKRDHEFFDWRYNEVPFNKYDKFGFWVDGILTAIIVYRKELVKVANAYVIRIVELFGEQSSLQKLVNGTILSKRVSEGVGWVDWNCSNQEICNYLKPIGFLTPEELYPAIVTIFTKPVDFYKKKYPYMFWSKDEKIFERLPPFHQWYVTKGDGDADRPNDNSGVRA